MSNSRNHISCSYENNKTKVVWNAYFTPKTNTKNRYSKKAGYITMLRFDYDGKYIDKRFVNKVTCKDMGLNHKALLEASKKGTRIPSYLGYIWIRESDYSLEELDYRVNLRKSIPTSEERILNKMVSVVQIDIETKSIVHIYPSISSAEIEGYDRYTIHHTLDGSKKTYAGCVWVRYDENVTYNEAFINALIENRISDIHNRPKKVNQLCIKTGKLIKEHNSLAEASKYTGIPKTTLKRLLGGSVSKKYNKYIWQAC